MVQNASRKLNPFSPPLEPVQTPKHDETVHQRSGETKGVARKKRWSDFLFPSDYILAPNPAEHPTNWRSKNQLNSRPGVVLAVFIPRRLYGAKAQALSKHQKTNIFSEHPVPIKGVLMLLNHLKWQVAAVAGSGASTPASPTRLDFLDFHDKARALTRQGVLVPPF
ncbi:MAG: hypothetical protein CM15mP120_21450 [Pseudomonadota bacterium]|nr:MAG: hypothetical protein CM15mP120_21450 [Pseudomonadota bacterium]